MQNIQRNFIFYSGLLGIIMWGLPASILFPNMLLSIFLSCLFGYLFVRITLIRGVVRKKRRLSRNFPDLIFIFALLFLIVDMSIGRQAYLNNLFFTSDSIDSLVQATDDLRGRGRGFFELLATIFLICPFFLYDFGRKSSKYRKYLYIGLSLVLIMNEIQASRGYLLMAVLSLTLASNKFSIVRIMQATIIAVFFFMLSSWFRGDFGIVNYSNPLFDGIAWPYINLGLYLGAECGNASYLEFLQQISQKILPSFIVAKDIISFNIEASECIYGLSLSELGSVSVFTYLAELHYYKPGYLVAATAGAFLSISTTYLDIYLSKYKLLSAQIFMGLFVILLLRSRILDIFSFFIALFLFIMVVKLLSTKFFGRIVPHENKS